LRRRLESIKQIQDTSEALEERLEEAAARGAEIDELLLALDDIEDSLQTVLHAEIDAEQGALIF
jgi:hypothetical protein